MNEQEVLDATVFLTLAGSQAYGTNTPESDEDQRGVCIPADKRLYFGFSRRNFEQKDKWASGADLCIYDFRKATDLMLGGNPNMVDLLFTPERMWKVVKQPWLELQSHRDKFLSKKMRYTYGGYAFAQLKRIKHHRNYLLNPPKKKPVRSDFGLGEAKAVSNDDLQTFLWLITSLLQKSVEMTTLSEDTKHELEQLNFIGIVQSQVGEVGGTPDGLQAIKKLTGMPDGFIDACMREKRYLAAMRGFEAYERWKEQRNPRRQAMEAKYGLDTKHAMHLVRLLRMGLEILKSGNVNIYRDDREELLTIRNGAWTYEQLEEYAEACDEQLNELYKTSPLPESPAFNEIERLCTSIVERHLQ